MKCTETTKYKYKVGDIYLWDDSKVPWQPKKMSYQCGFKYIGIIKRINHEGSTLIFGYKVIHSFNKYHVVDTEASFEFNSNVYNYSKIITEEELVALVL